MARGARARPTGTGPRLPRREFLRLTGTGTAAVLATPSLLLATACKPAFTTYGPLEPVNGDGLRIPAGFTSRIVATTGVQVGTTGFAWHANPDGGACFPTDSGGWIYVCNRETATPNGGVAAIEFDSAGAIVDAYDICTGTDRNCAGGATPWDTWLTCEEVSRGLVWECDPTGSVAAVARPAMGAFTHEAAAVHPASGIIYLTEDRTDGCLYRFTPTTPGDLSAGLLEVMTEVAGVLGWATIPDPAATVTSTRYQVADAKHFNGGEGAAWFSPYVYFTTKGDNRVWRYRPDLNDLTVLYDDDTATNPILTGVDNITIGRKGHAFIAEDGGDMQIVMIASGSVSAVVEIPAIAGSEVTGPAFSPDGTRLYFSSQRNPGATYEVTGPFK